MTHLISPRIILLTLLVFLLVATRFLPFPPNFSPLAAMALFGGAYFMDKRIAFALPLLALLASDMLLGFHSTMIFVYLGFAAIVGIGMKLFKRVNPARVIGGALGGSILFFMVTNLGVWLLSGMYPLSFEGLIAAYTAAIPFFHYTVASTLLFSVVFFGLFELAKRYYPALQPAAGSA